MDGVLGILRVRVVGVGNASKLMGLLKLPFAAFSSFGSAGVVAALSKIYTPSTPWGVQSEPSSSHFWSSPAVLFSPLGSPPSRTPLDAAGNDDVYESMLSRS
jgi:hypothetical protein